MGICGFTLKIKEYRVSLKQRHVTETSRMQKLYVHCPWSSGGEMLVRLALCVSLFCGISTHAAETKTPREEAQWMLERLTGVKWPADTPALDDMANRIQAGDRVGAAEIAVSKPQFLNVTVKQMALKISSREETVSEAFNDFTAAFIGVTRDQTDARELLTGNFYYRGQTAANNDLAADILGSNNHYLRLAELPNVGAALQRVEGQMILQAPGVPVANPDPAGVLTSRAFLAAHAIAGTNRRLVEYTFREFMCSKIENFADTNASDARIGRDIGRSPGGDPNKFQTSCKGCHTQMDGFRGAFAKWDFITNNGVAAASYLGVTTGGNLNPPVALNNLVVLKMNRDRNPNIFIEFPSGYVSTNDSWVNNSNRSVNATRFGWTGAYVAGGNGVKTFGNLIANSSRFTSCMAKRVWDSVCKYNLPEAEAETLYVQLGMKFASDNGYKLRELFKTVAAHPKCRM